MKIEIDIPEHHYNNIMTLDSVSLGRVLYKGIIMYSINAIKHGKVLEQAPRWIPVSERLPEQHICDDGYVEPSDYVLVYGGYDNYGVSRYWGDRKSKTKNPNSYKDWVDLDWIAGKPIAWQPLPEPYKESEGT